MRLSKFITTVACVGCIPFAPGTFGSVVGLVLACFLGAYAPHVFWLWLIVSLLLFGGWWFSHQELDFAPYEKGKYDPSYIVIDEVVGMMLAVTFVTSFFHVTAFDLLWLFLLFRLFDILKPFPIGWYEQRLCATHAYAAWGIMFDDVLAGLFAGMLYVLMKIIEINF